MSANKRKKKLDSEPWIDPRTGTFHPNGKEDDDDDEDEDEHRLENEDEDYLDDENDEEDSDHANHADSRINETCKKKQKRKSKYSSEFEKRATIREQNAVRKRRQRQREKSHLEELQRSLQEKEAECAKSKAECAKFKDYEDQCAKLKAQNAELEKQLLAAKDSVFYDAKKYSYLLTTPLISPVDGNLMDSVHTDTQQTEQRNKLLNQWQSKTLLQQSALDNLKEQYNTYPPTSLQSKLQPTKELPHAFLQLIHRNFDEDQAKVSGNPIIFMTYHDHKTVNTDIHTIHNQTINHNNTNNYPSKPKTIVPKPNDTTLETTPQTQKHQQKTQKTQKTQKPQKTPSKPKPSPKCTISTKPISFLPLAPAKTSHSPQPPLTATSLTPSPSPSVNP